MFVPFATGCKDDTLTSTDERTVDVCHWQDLKSPDISPTKPNNLDDVGSPPPPVSPATPAGFPLLSANANGAVAPHDPTILRSGAPERRKSVTVNGSSPAVWEEQLNRCADWGNGTKGNTFGAGPTGQTHICSWVTHTNVAGDKQKRKKWTAAECENSGGSNV